MKTGKVYLVGAGPGDPGLITMKGFRLLQSADVIVFDRLVDSAALAHARDDAEMIDVGKIPGERGRTQAHINAVLIEKAVEGKTVVRLQGGDPFVFGRGGEEAEDLTEAGVLYEVVPGVTSSIAAAAYAGIPVTHRAVASSFTVVTGNETPDKPQSVLDWNVLASLSGTLVVLMGWRNLPAITQALIRGGKPPDTPVGLVRWGTEPWQQTVTGDLSNIVDRAEAAGLSSPVVTVVGDVVSLRDALKWFDNRPLFGKRVLVTRTRSQSSKLAHRLIELGAMPVEVPTIEILPPESYVELDAELQDLARYDWIAFTSANAVDAVFERLAARQKDARALGSVRVAAIGPATARRLKANGIAADLMPASLVSEALVEAFGDSDLRGKSVLAPRADIARDVLIDGLESQGAAVRGVTAYRTVLPEGSRDLAKTAIADGIDIATFTSSSTVRNLLDLLDGDTGKLSGATIACIGPITETTAKEAGLEVDVSAEEHTIDGLISALEAHYS
ncbi:MAG: uroporphyrinogen-III C-methyltransferase [SAR202 cluster bacterium]|jgi:uroporphyrinogen III methyltransferase/synthase|nr:uroporphyrinogen-III C-methyltransferase [Chloroflexota bacterium]MDP6421232.1 uroporphyrinogen-III C-methyltransferase [SAR202 cluster bacterium]HAL47473.1 uroporphyrinogen-III C-methyltransferase [Dehalococcoidia bacterium]MDP6665348.1 uroporphyrinogen-III C-methyltransferase [SAR202 cluster bacterium]MDP6799599.1 uroporphyrinogen-III C-methyltransferase [SAR202 cluster bacterium]|tara:strand:+ start:27779 stop:29287 length:1509 start_codon:yes stop_codon:yes gene_type:complete